MKMLLTALVATAALGAGAPSAFAQHYNDKASIERAQDQLNHARNPNQAAHARTNMARAQAELARDRAQTRAHRWRQGERLDNRYGSYQPVNDWRTRRLPAPRRGYHWVRSGDDYVQAALVGGLIASVIAASR